jgi:hypothetical protein
VGVTGGGLDGSLHRRRRPKGPDAQGRRALAAAACLSHFQGVQSRMFRAGVLIVALAITAGLWVLPALAFPNPGINDAMTLADLTLPVVGETLLGCIVALALSYVRHWPSAGPVALGTFLIGVAMALVSGLVTIGNMSNDRFMPLLLLPLPFAVVGTVVLAFGLGRRTAGAARIGLMLGGIATALLLAWILARGSRDWLLAPYGFDVLLLILLGSAVVFVLGVTWRQSGGTREVASS